MLVPKKVPEPSTVFALLQSLQEMQKDRSSFVLPYDIQIQASSYQYLGLDLGQRQERFVVT